MDEKGYTITPVSLLLMIPLIILAVAFGDVVDEVNQFSTITIGSDVTEGTVSAVYTYIKYGAADSGRWGAYNVTRTVIDRQHFLTDSKLHVREVVAGQLSEHVVDSCSKLSRETGRNISINNKQIPINTTNFTMDNIFTASDIEVSQVDAYGKGDPYGFYVVVKAGVPIKVEQEGQVYEGTLPEIRGYAPIIGMEDPYIWIQSSFRTRNAIYPYSQYEKAYDGSLIFHFDDRVDINRVKIENLGDCLNGTGNPEKIPGMPQYFPNPNGLNFFERLQGSQIAGEQADTRLSTFVVGDPLSDMHQGKTISAVDIEYFAEPPIAGTKIMLGGNDYLDSRGAVFYLSSTYKTRFALQSNYNSNKP